MNDNELIAEFMGDGHLRNWHRDHWKDIPFATSWDWLMPVVEKIETPNLVKGYSFSVEMLRRLEDNQVTIYSIVRDTSFLMVNFQERDANKVQAVYKCVVKFIEWYNQQRQ